MNPYFDTTFFSFFGILFYRLLSYLQGNLTTQDLVSDEIQILVLSGIALSGAIVGTFLILRRMTMLANSLSHTILLGIVVTYLLAYQTATLHENPGQLSIPLMLIASLISGLLTAFLTEFLTKSIGLQADASTGLVFTTLFALGIICVTLFTRNAHVGTEVVMGNVDGLHASDCTLVGAILALNLLFFLLFYQGYKITSFDPLLARAMGFPPAFFNYLLMLQVSMTCVGAFRAAGVLMVLAFISGPPLIARRLTNRLLPLIGLAMLIGLIASILGVALSRHILTAYGTGLTTAGLVVCILAGMYLTVLISKVGRGAT